MRNLIGMPAGGAHDEAMKLLPAGDLPKTSNKLKHLLAKLYVEILCEQKTPVA